MAKSKANEKVLASREDIAITRMIAARVRRGESLERIARTARISYCRVRTLAVKAKIRYRGRKPNAAQIKAAIAAVRSQGKTFRQAAEMCEMSRTAVHRYVNKRRQAAIDRAGDVQFQDGNREFSKHKRSWRCPEHGLVTVWPCVACAARAVRRGTDQRGA